MHWITIGGPGFGTDDLPLAARIGQPRKRVVAHAHTYSEILIPRRGRAEHQTLGDRCRLGPGDVQVIPPGMPHWMSAVDGLHQSLIMVDWALLAPLLGGLREHPTYRRLFATDCRRDGGWHFAAVGQLADGDRQACAAICDELIVELVDRQAGWREAALATMVRLVAFLCRRCRPGLAAHSPDEGLNRALQAMATAPAEAWPLDRLAALAGCSVSGFCQRFRAWTGTSPTAHLIDLRLRRARHLLANSTTSITAIALDCGFGDSTYLARCFRRAMGCSPRSYRQRCAAPPES